MSSKPTATRYQDEMENIKMIDSHQYISPTKELVMAKT